MLEKITKNAKRMIDVLYISFVLDMESRQRLIEKTKQFAPDWENGRVIAEHHTIAFYTSGLTEEIYNWAVENENRMFDVVCYEYGVSDKAFAVKIKTDMPCANEIKHITVMVNPDNGGKPVDSNKITEWHSMPEFKLTGWVEFNYK